MYDVDEHLSCLIIWVHVVAVAAHHLVPKNIFGCCVGVVFRFLGSTGNLQAINDAAREEAARKR